MKRVLVITQAIDTNHTTLGFFTRWVDELSVACDDVQVICLYKGSYEPPQNVIVHSLGKEEGVSRIIYILRFFKYIWKLRHMYDVVFVHMNQEYIVLGGLLWKAMKKKVLFWRNHPHGNILTRIAVMFSQVVFYTADKSYTARFDKSIRMPAGVDTRVFTSGGEHAKGTMLVFGRLSPIKRIEFVIDAVTLLVAKGVACSLSIVGDTLPRDIDYLNFLKQRVSEVGLQEYIKFLPGVPFTQAPVVYGLHDICINMTPSGSFDKTVLEALACGTKVIVTNSSMQSYVPLQSYIKNPEPQELSERILSMINLSPEDQLVYADQSATIVSQESLDNLVHTLVRYM